MQVQDLYKLVHQASMGAEHAIGDSLTAVKYLKHEMRILRGSSNGPLCDPVSHSRKLVRVHLRPFVLTGENADALAKAFVATASAIKESPTLLQRYWRYAESAARAGKLPFAVSEMQTYYSMRAAQEHAAVHHSQHYRAAYRPAYRVVRRDFLPFSCK